MLGVCRKETPDAITTKIELCVDVPYVIALVDFCRYRFTGLRVERHGKVGFQAFLIIGLTTLLTANA